jgi:hypothetical protein
MLGSTRSAPSEIERKLRMRASFPNRFPGSLKDLIGPLMTGHEQISMLWKNYLHSTKGRHTRSAQR